ncbi:carboxypeptidase-like regulatory domain-containing protein [Clostridium psychrophilum]|uniref:carboxypeptidase-like regulatory domain-containing protein n=1 Tax=Clostridium psychrophilum TaxID=132926 RepID=UPI001C0D9CD0|nr:carboxypeptidase-like regulatory domain-containing protein [Clostridium psychrophilum]MBU3181562.1 carboxypeptidase-like regulatory domain-containing protein [Clostridium psychrophilum]
MCAVARKFLTGYELEKNETIELNFCFSKEKYFLLTGIVFNPIGEPLPSAALEITLINGNYNPPLENNIGVTFSQPDGSYGISLPLKSKYFYRITVYSPG